MECHPYFTQPKLLEYCRQNDIVIVGYCPLGSSRDASWYALDKRSLYQFIIKPFEWSSKVLSLNNKIPYQDIFSCLWFRVNLKSPPMLEDEVLVSIGRKYKKSSAQVALRFNVQRGVVVIPKSFSPERIKHNFQVGLSLFLNSYSLNTYLNKNLHLETDI